MTSGLVAFVCFGVGIVATFLSFILCAFDLLPNWRQLNEVKVLFLSQSFLCVTLFLCQSWLSLVLLEHRTQGTTEAAVTWLFIWLEAATLYNIAAITLVLYFAKTRNRHFAVSRVCLGTLFGVYLTPLIPLIPFAVFLEKTPCTYKTNRDSSRQLECLSSQQITYIETAKIFWRMCLHDALPAVVSLVCAINLFYSRNKYKFKSNFVNFDSSQRKSLIRPLTLIVGLSAFFLMLLFAVVLTPQYLAETTSDMKYDYKLLCFALFQLVASACVVFSCLSIMLDFGVQSEGSKNDIFMT